MWFDYLPSDTRQLVVIFICVILTLLIELACVSIAPVPKPFDQIEQENRRSRNRGVVSLLRMVIIAVIVVPAVVYLATELGLLHGGIKFIHEVEP